MTKTVWIKKPLASDFLLAGGFFYGIYFKNESSS
jgi:hypothetical protein